MGCVKKGCTRLVNFAYGIWFSEIYYMYTIVVVLVNILFMINTFEMMKKCIGIKCTHKTHRILIN